MVHIPVVHSSARIETAPQKSDDWGPGGIIIYYMQRWPINVTAVNMQS